jgi:hypothetical protein
LPLPFIFVAAAASAMQPMPVGQMQYSQGCGGCHGLLGVSARREIPVLRNRVGAFLCTRVGRDFVVRLPNVAFASMDNPTLAATLNFMMAGLGGASVPDGSMPSARPYTSAEVGALRARPLKASQLVRLRSEALAAADPACLQRAKN